MAKPISLQIVEAIRDRLYAIRREDGYNTDAGYCVELGVRQINPDEVDRGPIVTVYELQDAPVTEDANFCQQMPIELTVNVEALVRFGQDSKAEALAYLWQDIVRSVFLADTTLGGIALSVRRGAREYVYPSPGGETVAVTQAVLILYLETYGDP